MRRLTPLDYALRQREGLSLLAYETAAPGRIVEVLGDLQVASHIAVIVPGNAHRLETYRADIGAASPRMNAQALLREMRRSAPAVASSVVAWLGYPCPVGVLAAARDRAARDGVEDLVALTHVLPSTATITLVGHSYGSVLCGLAAGRARVHDLVALASPGLGVSRVDQLDTTARVWAGRCGDDWVRYLPRGRLANWGHGRQPADRKFGAIRFACDGASGHSGYYTPGSESLANIGRIAAGDRSSVTLVGRDGPPRRRRTRSEWVGRRVIQRLC